MTEHDDDRLYQVVRNGEEQYSVWPADRDPPAGWESIDVTGTRARCLAAIGEAWTDMRPRSLREATER